MKDNEFTSMIKSLLCVYLMIQFVLVLANMTTHWMVKVSGADELKCSTESIAGFIFIGSRIGCEIMYPRFK